MRGGTKWFLPRFRCCEMNDKLDSYIIGIKQLPATPAVLVRMIALFQQPDREVDDVVELMRQDPSLTAEVLLAVPPDIFQVPGPP